MVEATRVLPDVRAVHTRPIEMRINEVSAGIRAEVGIKLDGDDRQGPSVPFRMGRARDPQHPHKVGVTCTPGIGPPAPCVSSGRPEEPSPL